MTEHPPGPARPWADLHSHSHFSFLDGASSVEAMVERAVELGLGALALTDHQGLYGAVRFCAAAETAGLRPILGVEIELRDSAVPDPHHLVMPVRRARRPPQTPLPQTPAAPVDGVPVPVGIERARPPGHREPRREDLRGIRDHERGPHLVLLSRDMTGWESLCRMVSAAHLDGTKGVPRFTHELLARHADGLALLTGCRHGEVSRRLLAGDRFGARAALRWYAEHVPNVPGLGSGVFAELQHHLGPDDDLLVAETAAAAADIGLPTIVTSDAHYALAEDRELQDVLVAIRHGQTRG